MTVTVTNIGTRDGAEVVQLSLEFPFSTGEPPLQLKGFEKILLIARASARVTSHLLSRDLSIWDEAAHKWTEHQGKFGVAVGSSLSDIRVHN